MLTDPPKVDSHRNENQAFTDEFKSANLNLLTSRLHFQEIVPSNILFACHSESNYEAEKACYIIVVSEENAKGSCRLYDQANYETRSSSVHITYPSNGH